MNANFGHYTLLELATTLADGLREKPEPARQGQPAKLKADDRRRAQADFALTDLHGTTWTLERIFAARSY